MRMLAVFFLLCSAGIAQSPNGCVKCVPGHKLPSSFKIVRTTRLTTGGRIVYVALPRKYFDEATADTIASLACALRLRYPAGSDSLVLLFDNRKSAAHYVAPFEQEKPPDWKANESALRASYLSDPKGEDHHVYWKERGSGAKNVELCQSKDSKPPAQ
jgi:hypothetical protein